MTKSSYFGDFDGPGWPTPDELERYFLAPRGKEWSYRGGNDSWSLSVEGLEGTAGRPSRDQVKADLFMYGHPEHGVLLQYDRWDGRVQQGTCCFSKGDLTRLREWVRSTHDTPLPVGLFVPFEVAWPAVKEFLETDGALPTSIAWIAAKDLPPDTFPDP